MTILKTKYLALLVVGLIFSACSPYQTTTSPGIPGCDGLATPPFSVNGVFVQPYGVSALPNNNYVELYVGSVSGEGTLDGNKQTAQFHYPTGITLINGANGVELYVADTANHSVRKVLTDGTTTTVAGTSGRAGCASGTGTQAQFFQPTGIASDANGNLYVVDTLNNAIRKINPQGQVIYLAGSGQMGHVDGQGDAAQFSSPTAIALNPVSGQFAVLDQTNAWVVRLFDSAGNVSTSPISTNISNYVSDPLVSITYDANGNLYAMSQTSAYKFSSSGNLLGQWNAPTSFPANNETFKAIALDPSTGLINLAAINKYSNYSVIYTLQPSGVLSQSTLIGTVGSNSYSVFQYLDNFFSTASIDEIGSMVIDQTGKIYFTEMLANSVRVINSQSIKTVAGQQRNAETKYGLLSNTEFTGYRPDLFGYSLAKHTGQLVNFVTNYDVNTIPPGVPFSYVASRINTLVTDGCSVKFVDGENVNVGAFAAHATLCGNNNGIGSAATLGFLAGITIDEDTSGAENHTIYVIDVTNQVIRKIVKTPGVHPETFGWGPNTLGTVSTFAGVAGVSGDLDGANLSATFNFQPTSRIVFDKQSGALYVTDATTIRKIHNGQVTTIAGSSNSVGMADGVGTSAKFIQPSGLVHVKNQLFVMDNIGDVLREIDLYTMTVTTRAGQGLATTNINTPIVDALGNATGSYTNTSALFRESFNMTLSPTATDIYLSSAHGVIRKINLAYLNVSTVVGTTDAQGFKSDTISNAVIPNISGISAYDQNLYLSTRQGIIIVKDLP